jgi:hypothetical protein
MTFQTTEILIKTVGLILWASCLVTFPTVWALITLGLGAFQVLRCEKINSSVNKMFHQRTNQNSPLGYIEDDK